MKRNKKKRINPYDHYIEAWVQELAKNQDFPNHDPDSPAVQFGIKKLAELASFRSLFSHNYIPEAEKAVVQAKRDYKHSKYKDLFSLGESDFRENVDETIRLGFIGLFHKYEAFVTQLLLVADDLIKDTGHDEKITVKSYAKTEFGIIINDWKITPQIHFLNWINVCNKHHDGFPVKEPAPEFVENNRLLFPKDKRMKLTKKEFETAAASLLEFYPILQKVVFTIAIYKMGFDKKAMKNNYPDATSMAIALEKQAACRVSVEKMASVLDAIKKGKDIQP
jgi:hypothetical protein